MGEQCVLTSCASCFDVSIGSQVNIWDLDGYRPVLSTDVCAVACQYLHHVVSIVPRSLNTLGTVFGMSEFCVSSATAKTSILLAVGPHYGQACWLKKAELFR